MKTLVLTHLLGQIDLPRIREQIVHEIQQVPRQGDMGRRPDELTLAGARVANIETRQG